MGHWREMPVTDWGNSSAKNDVAALDIAAKLRGFFRISKVSTPNLHLLSEKCRFLVTGIFRSPFFDVGTLASFVRPVRCLFPNQPKHSGVVPRAFCHCLCTIPSCAPFFFAALSLQISSVQRKNVHLPLNFPLPIIKSFAGGIHETEGGLRMPRTSMCALLFGGNP